LVSVLKSLFSFQTQKLTFQKIVIRQNISKDKIKHTFGELPTHSYRNILRKKRVYFSSIEADLLFKKIRKNTDGGHARKGKGVALLPP
jgi:hypothetical protein